MSLLLLFSPSSLQYTAPCIPGTLSAVPGPYPAPSPHPLRGDTALSLPASCTHLMFLCRFSCGLVCPQALILFDGPGSPGSHTNCGFVSYRAISRESESDRSKNRNLEAPNLGRARLLLTHFPSAHTAHSTAITTDTVRHSRDHDIQQDVLRSRPSSTGGHAPVPTSAARHAWETRNQQLAGPLLPCRPWPLRQFEMDTRTTSGCVFLLGPLSACLCFPFWDTCAGTLSRLSPSVSSTRFSHPWRSAAAAWSSSCLGCLAAPVRSQ